MCFHYSLAAGFKTIGTRFKTDTNAIEEFIPMAHINGFSHPRVPIITAKQNKNVALLSAWGLIPEWVNTIAKAKQIRASTLNARSETVFEKPSFKNAIKQHRCLVPATGYFEWKHFEGKKYPHFIFSKCDTIFSMAGIYTEWGTNLGQKSFHTFSVLTKPANNYLSKVNNIHNRMPILVSTENEKSWLHPQTRKREINELINFELNEDLDFYTIGQHILASPPEDMAILKPVNYPELNTNLLF